MAAAYAGSSVSRSCCACKRCCAQHYQAPELVLADHFDLFAGTSTGAIIATCLCWGMTVEQILDLYLKFGTTMFTPVPWYKPYKKYLVSRYDAKPLSEFLQRLFSEDGEGKTGLAGQPSPEEGPARRGAQPLHRFRVAAHQQSTRHAITILRWQTAT